MDQQSTERVHAVAQAATISGNLAPRSTGLIVAERRAFFRGCLTHWLGQFSDEFQTLAVPDVETTQDEALLKDAAAILIGAGRAERADGWLSRQVEWLAARCPGVPIAVLMEAPDPGESRAVETISRQLGVQGCITTSTSLNVAVAALRLVVAGGTVLPDICACGSAIGSGSGGRRAADDGRSSLREAHPAGTGSPERSRRRRPEQDHRLSAGHVDEHREGPHAQHYPKTPCSEPDRSCGGRAQHGIDATERRTRCPDTGSLRSGGVGVDGGARYCRALPTGMDGSLARHPLAGTPGQAMAAATGPDLPSAHCSEIGLHFG